MSAQRPARAVEIEEHNPLIDRLVLAYQADARLLMVYWARGSRARAARVRSEFTVRTCINRAMLLRARMAAPGNGPRAAQWLLDRAFLRRRVRL